GSEIALESDPSRGSRFEFEVLLEIAAEADPAKAPRTFAGLRALVVDDHASQREVMTRELRALGVEVETAASAESAIEAVERSLLSKNPFSLLLLDSRMPGVDVLALAATIRERARISSVLLTPSHERIDSEVLRLHGIAGQLTKPVAPSHLVRAIEILSRGEIVEKPEDVQTQGMDRPLLAGLKVLLAEDHPINRTVVIRVLENQGGEVVAVTNGREALDRWSKERFDILVLDVEMPDVDGLEVARRIRAHEGTTGGRLPIVALTAHARDEHRERCLAAGMDAFVTKPFEESELLAAMRGAFKREAPAESPKPASDRASLVLDREAAVRRANGDAVLLGELTQIFLEETPDTMRRIESALQSGDARNVERLAHRLKGALLTLSAPAASRSALDLEAAARAGRDEDSRRALARLKQE
ncbi:MAG: response regulator, partial [Vicinamibacteria bacterium]